MKLVLVRHGRTNKNISGLLHSRSDESLLDEVGKAQMQKVAQRLKQEFWPFYIHTSVEARARESARIISELVGADALEAKGFEERNWGEFEGCPWTEVKRILDQLSLAERFIYRPPGGENWGEFKKRTVQALRKIIKEKDNKNVVIVTHGGVIRVLLPFLLNVPKEESFKYDPANASLTVFNYEEEKFYPALIDDVSHLDL